MKRSIADIVNKDFGAGGRPLRRKAGRIAARAAKAAALVVCAVLVFTAAAFAEGAEETRYIVKLKADPAAETGSAPFEVVSEEVMLALDRAGLLEWYEEDGQACLLGDLSNYFDDEKWDLQLIRADEAFARGYMGQGVIVGVIDTGVSAHSAFADRLLPGACFVDGLDPDDTEDTFGHGTKVAGLIAASGESGYIGAAPLAKIVPLKCSDGSILSISSIVAAIYSAVDDFHCDVINLSLGTQTDFNSLREAIDYAVSRNVTIVAAAGNDGNTTLYYPAGYDNVIGVGSVQQNGSWYSGANHNASVFVCAPGVGLKTTTAAAGYASSNGTSFAAPQTAAAAAVMLSVDHSLTPAQIMTILSENSVDKGVQGRDDYYGYGVIDIAACVEALAGNVYAVPTEGFELLSVNGQTAAIKNDAAADLSCVCFLAEYEESGRFIGLSALEISVPAYRAVSFEPPAETAVSRHFLCSPSDLTKLVPNGAD